MRPLIILLAVVALTASCTGDNTEDRPLSTPGGVVTSWLGALEALDIETLTDTTDPANVALVAGAENGFGVDQMAAVVEDGLPPATARSYWTTFREGLAAFVEPPLDALTVDEVERFTIAGSQFAAVTVRRDGATAEIITVLVPDGWKVDLMATAGPVLAVQIRRLVAEIVDRVDDEAVARRYTTIAVDSLDAALSRDPANRALELEVEAIGELPIDLGR